MTAARLFLGVGCAVALAGSLAPREVAAQPADDGAHRGYLAARLGAGGAVEIDARHADRFFVPASVLKIITVAAALEHLGPEYRWVTRLTSAAAIDATGLLDGDLRVEPGADPTWSDEFFDDGAATPLADLAGQIRARGITRVGGDLVVDASRFPGRPHPAGRPFADLPYRLGTPTAAWATDDATVTIRVGPGARVGAPARVDAPAGVAIINLTTTVGRDRHGAGTLDFVPVWGTDTLVLRGEYPISEPPFVVDASDPAPVQRAARRLADALADAGVVVRGEPRVERHAAPDDDAAVTLAAFSSRPLADLLEPILAESRNWYADMVALTLGRDVAGTGRFDDGVEVIADFATELLHEPGDGGRTPAPAVWLEDGSGLSRSNLVTPAVVVRVLAHVRAQPWGERFIGALATPDRGTLAAWPRLPPVAAKTGSLRHTVALAGFLDADSDTPVVFCYVVNHHPARSGPARREIAAAVGRWRAGGATR